MKLDVVREDVWAVGIEDRPGDLAEKLEALAQAGANLEFVIGCLLRPSRAPSK